MKVKKKENITDKRQGDEELLLSLFKTAAKELIAQITKHNL